MDGRTQAVYDPLGLPHAELADDWSGVGLDAEGDHRPRRGLRHLPDALIDSAPPSEPHTVKVSDVLDLQGIPRAQTGPALRRARETLTRQGWKLVSNVDSGDDLQLRLCTPDSGDTVMVEAYSIGRLRISVEAACARYPADTPMISSDQPALPALKAPVQLRG